MLIFHVLECVGVISQHLVDLIAVGLVLLRLFFSKGIHLGVVLLLGLSQRGVGSSGCALVLAVKSADVGRVLILGGLDVLLMPLLFLAHIGVESPDLCVVALLLSPDLIVEPINIQSVSLCSIFRVLLMTLPHHLCLFVMPRL